MISQNDPFINELLYTASFLAGKVHKTLNRSNEAAFEKREIIGH